MAASETFEKPRLLGIVQTILAGLVLALVLALPLAVLAQPIAGDGAGWNASDVVTRSVLALLAAILPASILIGRGVVRRCRLETIERLEEAMRANGVAPDFASFAIVKNRYCDARAASDRFLPYALPILIFVALSFAGFYSAFIMAGMIEPWSKANLLLAGMASPGETGFADLQRRSAAVVTFAFFGAYVWSIMFLIKRIANYDLSAISFLRVSAHAIFACFSVGAVWHLGSGLGAFLGDGAMLPMAFLIGFFPALGLDALIRRFPQLQAKRIDERAATLSPSLPLNMIDGIDWFIAYRLAEYEIEDAQNLAAANPFELFAATPYGLYQVIDWIQQAQLLAAVGPAKVEALRKLNVRSLRDIAVLRDQPDLRKAVQRALLGDELGQIDDPLVFDCACATLGDDLHTRRLEQIWLVLARRYDEKTVEAVAPALRIAAE